MASKCWWAFMRCPRLAERIAREPLALGQGLTAPKACAAAAGCRRAGTQRRSRKA